MNELNYPEIRSSLGLLISVVVVFCTMDFKIAAMLLEVFVLEHQDAKFVHKYSVEPTKQTHKSPAF